eukprot:TRINITY_DN3162_c0_g1_i1.p1 TRINITY_DN3162_c0_g1~~TRINITY_DN3162_c0_g1_i1.p1  ORF type:complete len:697 (+),score=184.41 TRINITY_DN3162_c0_g1_i1:47-2137(+)
MNPSEGLKEALGKSFNKLDTVITNYLIDVLGIFKDGREEMYEILTPFLSEIEPDNKKVKQICDNLFVKIRGDIQDKDNEQEVMMTPVNMQELAKEMDEEAEKKTSWMKSEVSVNFSDGVQGALYSGDTKGLRKKAKESEPKTDKSGPQNPKDFVKKRRAGGVKTRDVQVKNFDMHLAGKTLLESATLNLVGGRKYGLVGRNGIGKTTLMRYISSGELNIPEIDILHVEQEVVGDDTPAVDSVLQADLEREELIREEQKLLQATDGDPEEKDKRLSQIYMRMAEIEADKAPSVASAILAGLGFTPEMQQMTTQEFSGGWRMRLALARALFCQPELLLLDEPTNMLDMQAVLWLENYLNLKWKNTLLVVSHDREFLNIVATDIVHFQNKKLDYYPGNYDRFEDVRNERLANQQRSRAAQQLQRDHIQKFIDRFRFNAKRASLVQSRLKYLSKLAPVPAMVEDPSMTFSFPSPDALRPPLVQFTDVAFGYEGKKNLFEKINFSVDVESRIALVGSNGQGKSTILSLLCGELKSRSGFVIQNPRLRLAKFSQHHVDQMPLDKTPLEFLQMSFPGKDSQVYREMLGRYGISGEMVFQKNSTLSGGQKSRVSFAHLAMQQPHLIVLDEPTNHLDIETVDVLARALNDFTGSVVVVSHNERLITLVCDEIWVVDKGKINPFKGDFEQYKKRLITTFQQQIQVR